MNAHSNIRISRGVLLSAATCLLLGVLGGSVNGAIAPDKNAYRQHAKRHKGDAKKGRLLFQHRSCVDCHRTPGQGDDVGPDLHGIGDKDIDFLIDAILQPSKTIRPGYGSIVVLTRQEQLIRGRFIHKSPEHIVLETADGTQRKIAVADVVHSKLESDMPQNLHTEFTLQEFADLIAYLQELKENGSQRNSFALAAKTQS